MSTLYLWTHHNYRQVLLLYIVQPHYIMSSESEEWSSQWIFQFKQLEEKAWKNQGFNGIRTRDRRIAELNWPRSQCVAS